MKDLHPLIEIRGRITSDEERRKVDVVVVIQGSAAKSVASSPEKSPGDPGDPVGNYG